jgi:hypothetical protein
MIVRSFKDFFFANSPPPPICRSSILNPFQENRGYNVEYLIMSQFGATSFSRKPSRRHNIWSTKRTKETRGPINCQPTVGKISFDQMSLGQMVFRPKLRVGQMFFDQKTLDREFSKGQPCQREEEFWQSWSIHYSFPGQCHETFFSP